MLCPSKLLVSLHLGSTVMADTGLESESLFPTLCFLHQHTRTEDPSAFSALRPPSEVLRRGIIIPTHLCAPFFMLIHLPETQSEPPAPAQLSTTGSHSLNAPFVHFSRLSSISFFSISVGPAMLKSFPAPVCHRVAWAECSKHHPSALVSSASHLTATFYSSEPGQICVLQGSLIIGWAKTS